MKDNKNELSHFKAKVMKEKGYQVSDNQPDEVKYEIADELGIPLSKKYNGNITAKDAGKIGGSIGGSMVKEMVRMAQRQMTDRK